MSMPTTNREQALNRCIIIIVIVIIDIYQLAQQPSSGKLQIIIKLNDTCYISLWSRLCVASMKGWSWASSPEYWSLRRWIWGSCLKLSSPLYYVGQVPPTNRMWLVFFYFTSSCLGGWQPTAPQAEFHGCHRLYFKLNIWNIPSIFSESSSNSFWIGHYWKNRNFIFFT